MVALILDVENKEFFDYTGIESFLSLSLLTTTIHNAITSELELALIDKTYFYGNNSNLKDKNYLNNFEVLRKTVSSQNDNKIFLSLSSLYFELDEAFTSINSLSVSCVAVTDKHNKICGFVMDKDYFLDMLKNTACTEIYKQLERSTSIGSIIDVNYCKHIENINDYKSLLADILNNKTKLILPCVAEKIYATGNMPKGDFVIVPPVFIGENVQIENECIIGPNTIICDNTLISNNSHIKASVLLKDNYVSSGCFLENAFLCEGACVLRNSAVFNGSVLGRFSSVSEETFLENDSKLRPYVKTGDYYPSGYSNRGSFTFSGCTPEYAAMVGGALGTLFKNCRFAVLTDGEINSVALKYALVSGFLSTGARSFDLGKGYTSMLSFYLSYFDIDYGIFIKGGQQGTLISIINKSGEYISIDKIVSIKDIIKKNLIERADKEHCFDIRILKGMSRLYVKNIIKKFDGKLQIFPVFNCKNNVIKAIADEIIDEIGCRNCCEQIIFEVNEDGTNAVCRIKDVTVTKNKLLDFVAFYGSECESQTVFNRRFDAVYLCFEVLYILSSGDLDFYTEINNLPSFFVAEKSFETQAKLPSIASKLSAKYNVGFIENKLIFGNDNVKMKIINNTENNFCLVARSKRFEISEEIVGDIIKMITDFKS